MNAGGHRTFPGVGNASYLDGDMTISHFKNLSNGILDKGESFVFRLYFNKPGGAGEKKKCY